MRASCSARTSSARAIARETTRSTSLGSRFTRVTSCNRSSKPFGMTFSLEELEMSLLEQHALTVENRGDDLQLPPCVLVLVPLSGNPHSIADDDRAIAS